MSGRVREWLGAAAGVLVTALSTAALGAIDLVRSEDVSPKITWKSDAETTLAHNLEQWRAELAEQIKDESLRERALLARELALQEALITRHEHDDAVRRRAARRAADLWLELNPQSEEAAAALRRVVELSPGDGETAAAALWALGRRGGEDRLAWLEYAYERMQALARLGLISEEDSRLRELAEDLFTAYLSRGWLHQARAMLDRLPVTHREDQVMVAFREAEIMWAAGDGAGAVRRMQQALDLAEESSKWGPRARERIKAYRSVQLNTSAPMYATAAGLASKLESSPDLQADALVASLDAVYAQDPYEAALIRLDSSRHAAAWHVLAGRVSSLSEPARQALARLHQDVGVPAADDPEGLELLRAFRRAPLNPALVQAMLDLGERSLWEGRPHAALRSFEDVLTWAGQREWRDRALVGRWAALAALDDPDLAKVMQVTNDQTSLPWRGETVPAGQIKQQLVATTGPAPSAAAPTPLGVLKSSPEPWWPQNFAAVAAEEAAESFTQLGAGVIGDGAGVWLTSPGVLAGYFGGSVQPAWTLPLMRVSAAARESGQEVTVPGVFEPALHEGVLYTRCGVSVDGTRLADVAAVDARTGELKWTTARDPAWRSRWPISDPVLADGRLYVLTLTYDDGSRALLVPVSLSCLDADTGRSLWHRTIAMQSMEVILGIRLRREGVRAADLAHYGNRVLVHQGAVYCATNMGLLARLDARDGLIDWTRHYDRLTLGSQWARSFRRVGGQPIAHGDHLLVAPRDYPGMLTVNRHTGELVWARPDVPSQRVIGKAGGLALVCDDAHVAGIDPATGSLAWIRRIEGGLRLLPHLSGQRLYVAGRQEAVVLDAVHGTVIQTIANVPAELAGWGEGAGRLWAVSASPADTVAGNLAPPPTPGLGAAAAGKPGLPLRWVWSLDRSRPVLLPASTYRSDDSRWVVRSDTHLDMIDLRAANPWLWQRRVDPGLIEVVWGRDMLWLIYTDRVVVLETSDGRPRHTWRLRHAVNHVQTFGPSLVIRDQGSMMSVFDLESGQLAWTRDWINYKGFKFSEMSLDQGEMLLIGQVQNKRRPVIFVAPADGRVLRSSDHAGKIPDQTVLTRLVGSDIIGLTGAGKLYRLSLRDGALVEYKAKSTTDFSHQRVALHVSPPWIQVRRYKHGSRAVDFEHWVYRWDDPSYLARYGNDGYLFGNHLRSYEGDKLVLTDLTTRKQVGSLTMPKSAGRQPLLLDVRAVPEGWLMVVGQVSNDRTVPRWIQVARYRAEGGEPIEEQVLNATEWAFSGGMDRERLAWSGAALLVAQPAGVDIYGPGRESQAQSALRLPPLDQAPIIDGRDDDWPRDLIQPDSAEQGATLRLAWRDWTLLGLVTVPADAPRTWHGGLALPDGDRLELAISPDAGAGLRVILGVDELGRLVTSTGVAGLQAAVRHDLMGRRLTYEFALPVQTLRIRREDGAEAIRLSLAAHRGEATLLKFGHGMVGADLIRLKHRVLIKP